MVDRNEQIERLRKRYREAPDSKAFAPLADILRRDGQLEEALVLLEDGLSRYPSYLTAMVILGQALMDAQRGDHARKVLVRVLDLDPDNCLVLKLLAEDSFAHEIWHLALPWLERLIELEPEQNIWVEMLARVRSENSDSRPEDASESSESDNFATLTMVDIYIEQGYLTKALAALKVLQSRGPSRTDVKGKLVEVLSLMDQKSDRQGGLGGQADSQDWVARRRRRSTENAEKRGREKQQFNDWVNGAQPGEGNSQ